LCGAEWGSGVLTERLTLELSALSEVNAIKTRISDAIRAITPNLSTISRTAADIADIASELELVKDGSPIASWTTVLSDYLRALGEVADDATTLKPLTEPPSIACPPPVANLLLELAGQTKALNPDLTPAQKSWDVLTRLTDCLERLDTAATDSAAADLIQQRAECLLISYNEAKNTVLTDLYESVKARFVELYSQLHSADGEANFTALLEPGDAAVKFLVDFYGRGMYPPHALHSEGHQDSMGICLYLALSEHINKSLIGVTVLDDVVMSVDASHRKSLCRVLNTAFAGHQFIITTHDRSWAQQLRTEGVVTAKGIQHFVGWSVESGPRVNEGDMWKTITHRLAEDDVNGAAALLRSGMEEFFADVCERFWAPVIYRNNAGYTLGDFLPAAYSRYTQLLNKAKNSAKSWGQKETLERLADAESVAKQCYQRTEAEQWTTNKSVHFDRWHQLTAADLSGVVDAFKDMCGVFICPSCESVLSVSGSASKRSPKALRCSCQAVDWNLVSKSA
jgi:hypothetical protein